MKQATRKRNSLKARALAAIDVDRPERNYRRHEAAYREARRSGLAAHIAEALRRVARADEMWLHARKRGLMVESIWRV